MRTKVIGYYNSKFGELWNKSLADLIDEAIAGVLQSVRLARADIDAVFFGNMLGGILENSLFNSALIAQIMETTVPVYRLEAACASGGLAFQTATNYLKSNKNKTVLVLGAEKMTDVSVERATEALTAASAAEEQIAGLTFPGLYAMMAQVYLHQYRYDEEHLAYISVKNHYHGSLNEKAQFRKTITVDKVLASPYVAYPLKILSSSAISDGAAALILTNDPVRVKSSRSAVDVLSSEVATDCLAIKNRDSLTELYATQVAAEKAFCEAKIKRNRIDVAEVHDCFSIAEILAMEDIGFWKRGEGGKKAKEMSTQLGTNQRLVVNTSGGLKAAGHPVGATGVKQIGELFLQLTKQAKSRLVKNAHFALAHNVGGAGGMAVVSILAV
ncbi:hypothetical protein A3F03_01565 [Candidatus Roizmanbacteria bacterium RIFCSPHIGHO2_12_FULL_41_11]|uniref:Acetyl-CoA acetyltransferase n=2 Tax=Candidatus Roizmaniibacteriota TaxID=1752723 RepID=A0A1F7J9L6_9BACT|nr:MAG: hypothetical protein A3F03_01565 [Candidatus Roizmanbacteria bacterium RIFCSPHIGHO2_12_FULL_41_11]OGK52281.1 MAG: hypothetical protein A2966_03235 [Candidatus Roizmanbacteria bacterium RIFCSPLOWO2_01_FULL_41_22]